MMKFRRWIKQRMGHKRMASGHSETDVISGAMDDADRPILARENSCNRWQPLEYQSLQGSDIRLIEVGKAQPDGMLHCTMHHAPLSADLYFNALSYVWGDGNDTIPILVNGQSLQVTRNLYQFLHQISKSDDMCRHGVPLSHLDVLEETAQLRYRGPLYWWIDAICIDQDCVEEKNLQVPRMGELYSAASQVWVWFGLAQAIFTDTEGVFHHTRILLSKPWTLGDPWTFEIVGYFISWGERLKANHISILSRLVVNHYIVRGRTTRRNLDEQIRSRGLLFDEVDIQEAIDLYRSMGTSFMSKKHRSQILATMLMDSDKLKQPSSYMQALLHELRYLLDHPWFSRIWTLQEYALSKGKVKAMIGDYTFWIAVLLNYVFKTAAYSESSDQQTLDTDPLFTRQFYRMNSLLRIEQDCRRIWRSGTSSLTSEQACIKLLGYCMVRESTIPHDRIYGILGLLPRRLPTFLDPDYNLPYKLVCWRYVQHLISVTQDLRIIETETSKLDGVPSWVHTLLHLPPDIVLKDRPAIASISFSGDGEQITVKGLCVDKILACTCGASNLVEQADYIQHVLIPQSSSILGLSYEQKLADFVWRIPRYVRSDRASVIEVVKQALTLDKSTAILQLISVTSREEEFQQGSYGLLSSGIIGRCSHRRGVVPNLENRDELWALKGCSMPSILRRVDGGYLYVGCMLIEVEEPDSVGTKPEMVHKMDGAYFADKDLQDVTIV